MIIVGWVCLLFLTIGIAASDFFCVNLSTISNVFGIGENLAGVTLLAFGNGSPDVFSTFAAIRSNSGSLAVGELIGAAGFIAAVVTGSMAIVRPFKVTRHSFVRDVGFFVVAVAFSMVFVANGSLELWECASMVGFYAFYVFIVLVWHWWLERRRRRRERSAMVRGYYADDAAEHEVDFQAEYHDQEEPRAARAVPSRHPSSSEFHEVERSEIVNEEFDELEEETERDKWMGELSSNMRITQTPIGERRNIFNPIRPSLAGALEFQSVLRSLRRSRNIQERPMHLRRFSDDPDNNMAHRQSRALSTASDPEVASTVAGGAAPSEGSTEGSQTDSNAARQGVHGRGRAKSANAADLLGLSPTTWHRRQRSRSNLSSPRPTSRYSDQDNLTVPGQEQGEPSRLHPHDDQPSPLVTVEPPPDEPRTETSPPGRPQVGAGTLLAPPPSSAESNTETLAASPSVSGESFRPQLRITPPTPSPDIGTFSHPSSSSLIPPARTPPADGATAGDMFSSPESVQPVYPQSFEPSRPLKWWPHKVFAPPEEIIGKLVPTLRVWTDKKWYEKLSGIVSAPSVFLLAITLPVVEPEAAESHSGSYPTPPSHDKVTSGGSQLDPSQFTTDPLSELATSAEAPTGYQHPSPHPPSQQYVLTETQEEYPQAAVPTTREWNRWLVLLQSFTAPYLVLLAVWTNFWESNPSALVRPTIYCLGASLVVCLLVLSLTHHDKPPSWHFLLCFVGFAVSVTWISSIANEVVGVLKACGVILNWSDAILGLTIFAIGNSMGDFVADITIANLGFPVMALSACFGGPMLNILLGIGLSGGYMVLRKADHQQHKHPGSHVQLKPYKVEVSTTLMISAVALLVTLSGLLIVVPMNRWTMDRKVGIGLIVLWLLGTAGNVAVEISGAGNAYG